MERRFSKDSRHCSIGLKQHQLSPLPLPIPAGAHIMLIGAENSKVSLQLPEAQAVVAWLREHFDATQHHLACVCSGTMLAAYAGLLDQRMHHTSRDSGTATDRSAACQSA